MQTYLLAFVISDYSYVEIHGKIPQRVFAPRHRIEAGHGDFGVRAGVDILRQLDTYFDMDYSANNVKIDQIAIPDFFFGAMVSPQKSVQSSDLIPRIDRKIGDLLLIVRRLCCLIPPKTLGVTRAGLPLSFLMSILISILVSRSWFLSLFFSLSFYLFYLSLSLQLSF